MPHSALLVLSLLLAAAPAAAQQSKSRADSAAAPHAGAWTPLFRHEGVAMSFIHYRRADNENSGVVLRLVNENEYAVRYRLKLAFLGVAPSGEDEWRTGRAAGTLRAGQMKTGSDDGLFWVPFSDGRRIAEVRLPEYHVTPLR